MKNLPELAIHIDYLQGLVRFNSIDFLSDFVSFLNSSGDTWSISDHSFWCGRSFSKKLSSVWGGLGGYNLLPTCLELILVFPGEYFSFASESWIITLISKLREVNFSCTRIDIAVDDFSKSVPFEFVSTAAIDNACIGFESYRFIDGNGVKTVYFGSPSSDKQLRFYDADFVHQIGSHRWELQLRGDYAHSIFSDLDLDFLCSSLAVFFFSLVRFSDCSWWSNFSAGFDSIKFLLPRRVFSLGKLETWLQRQVVPTLCIFRFGLGKEAFIQYLEDHCHSALFGNRLSPKHYAFIDFLNVHSEVV